MKAGTDPTLQRKIVFNTNEQSLPQMDEFISTDNQTIQRGFLFGKCLMCAHDVLFSVEHANLRETIVCPICRSYNRQRQLIATLSLQLFDTVLDLKTLIGRLEDGTKVLILEDVTNFASAFKFYAGERVKVYTTEYIDPKLKSGDLSKSGIMHLDIERTNFEDNFFDIVLHADVFEHVPNAPDAEKEQIRVLKKGGIAVYTAPFGADMSEDDIYAEVKKGDIKYYKEALYHGDPSPREDGENQGGCLVFRVFSYPGMYTRYKEYGANFSCHYLYAQELGILGNNAYIFSATKK